MISNKQDILKFLQQENLTVKLCRDGYTKRLIKVSNGRHTLTFSTMTDDYYSFESAHYFVFGLIPFDSGLKRFDCSYSWCSAEEKAISSALKKIVPRKK